MGPHGYIKSSLNIAVIFWLYAVNSYEIGVLVHYVARTIIHATGIDRSISVKTAT